MIDGIEWLARLLWEMIVKIYHIIRAVLRGIKRAFLAPFRLLGFFIELGLGTLKWLFHEGSMLVYTIRRERRFEALAEERGREIWGLKYKNRELERKNKKLRKQIGPKEAEIPRLEAKVLEQKRLKEKAEQKLRLAEQRIAGLEGKIAAHRERHREALEKSERKSHSLEALKVEYDEKEVAFRARVKEHEEERFRLMKERDAAGAELKDVKADLAYVEGELANRKQEFLARFEKEKRDLEKERGVFLLKQKKEFEKGLQNVRKGHKEELAKKDSEIARLEEAAVGLKAEFKDLMEMNPVEKEAYSYLLKHSKSTRNEIAEGVGLDPHRVWRALKGLIKKGKVKEEKAPMNNLSYYTASSGGKDEGKKKGT